MSQRKSAVITLCAFFVGSVKADAVINFKSIPNNSPRLDIYVEVWPTLEKPLMANRIAALNYRTRMK